MSTSENTSTPNLDWEKSEKKDITVKWEDTPSTDIVEKPKIKLNLKALSKNVTDAATVNTEEKTETDDTTSEKIQKWDQEKILEDTQQDTSDKEKEGQKEDVLPVKKPKISLWSIKSQSDTTKKETETETATKSKETSASTPKTESPTEKKSTSENTPEEKGTPSEKPEEETEKLFGNYESHFEKKSQNFIDRIRNFQTSPKTRIWLIVFLITITIGVIGSLMYLAPEKHWFRAYKWSLMQIYNIFMVEPSTPTNSQTPLPTPVENPTSTPIVETLETTTPEVTPEEKNREEKKQKVKDFLLENYGK